MLRLLAFASFAFVVVAVSGCITPGTKLSDFKPLAVGIRTSDDPGYAVLVTGSVIRPNNLAVDGNKIEWNHRDKYVLAGFFAGIDALLPMTVSEGRAREAYPFLLGLLVFDHVQLSSQSGGDEVSIGPLNSQNSRILSTQTRADYSFMYPVYTRSVFASAGISRSTRRVELFGTNQENPEAVYLRKSSAIVGARWIPLDHALIALDIDIWQSDTEVESHTKQSDAAALIEHELPFKTRARATFSLLF